MTCSGRQRRYRLGSESELSALRIGTCVYANAGLTRSQTQPSTRFPWNDYRSRNRSPPVQLSRPSVRRSADTRAANARALVTLPVEQRGGQADSRRRPPDREKPRGRGRKSGRRRPRGRSAGSGRPCGIRQGLPRDEVLPLLPGAAPPGADPVTGEDADGPPGGCPGGRAACWAGRPRPPGPRRGRSYQATSSSLPVRSAAASGSASPSGVSPVASEVRNAFAAETAYCDQVVMLGSTSARTAKATPSW